MALSGRSRRRKGHDWEREVARLFREAMPGCEAKRGLAQSRGGDAEGSDVGGLEHFTVECKHHRLVNVPAAMREAIAAEEPGKWPLAVTKSDRQAPLVTMRLEDFLELASIWWIEVRRSA